MAIRTENLLPAVASALMLAATLLVLPRCSTEEPTAPTEEFTNVDFLLDADRDTIKARLLDDIGQADDRIEVALSRLADTDLAEALVAARARGVEVRVVADWDVRDDAGFARLEAGSDPDAADANEIYPVLGDGEIFYLPDPNLASFVGQCDINEEERITVCRDGEEQGALLRPGSYNVMSHDFVLIDREIVWNLTGKFDGTNRPWAAWRAQSVILYEDFRAEFTQMHGGVFSTNLDTYNGPNKSTADYRVLYHTADEVLRVRFNPQERLVKTLIDQIYAAKASVQIMTDSIENPQLIDALEYKAAATTADGRPAFDVQVIVHPDHQVPGSQRDRLEAMGARYIRGVDHLPTMAIFDDARDHTGRRRPRKAAVLSHPLWHATPYELQPGPTVAVYPSDTFIDGNMWELVEYASQPGQSAQIDQLVGRYAGAWESTDPMQQQ